jgi:predicted nucleic acid-binding protein
MDTSEQQELLESAITVVHLLRAVAVFACRIQSQAQCRLQPREVAAGEAAAAAVSYGAQRATTNARWRDALQRFLWL